MTNRLFQQVLAVAAPELDVGRNRRDKLNQRMVEQRNAAFQSMSHAHTVLDMQQRRQQALEIEMRHLVEVGLVADIVPVVENFLERSKHP